MPKNMTVTRNDVYDEELISDAYNSTSKAQKHRMRREGNRHGSFQSTLQIIHLLVNMGILGALVMVGMKMDSISHSMSHDAIKAGIKDGVQSVINDPNITDGLVSHLEGSAGNVLSTVFDSDAVEKIGKDLITGILDDVTQVIAGTIPDAAAYFLAADYKSVANMTAQGVLTAKQMMPAMGLSWRENQHLNITLVEILGYAKIAEKWQKLNNVDVTTNCTDCSIFEAIEKNLAVDTWAELAPSCKIFANQLKALPWNATSVGNYSCFQYTTEAYYMDKPFHVVFNCEHPSLNLNASNEAFDYFNPCEIGCCGNPGYDRLACCYSGGHHDACPETVPICPFGGNVLASKNLQIGITYDFSTDMSCSSTEAYCPPTSGGPYPLIEPVPRDMCTYNYSPPKTVQKMMNTIADQMSTVCSSLSKNHNQTAPNLARGISTKMNKPNPQFKKGLYF